MSSYLDPQSSNSSRRGSIYTTGMESGSQNHKNDGLLGPNSMVAVCLDPSGL